MILLNAGMCLDRVQRNPSFQHKGRGTNMGGKPDDMGCSIGTFRGTLPYRIPRINMQGQPQAVKSSRVSVPLRDTRIRVGLGIVFAPTR